MAVKARTKWYPFPEQLSLGWWEMGAIQVLRHLLNDHPKGAESAGVCRY
jgi:hypothetical protein